MAASDWNFGRSIIAEGTDEIIIRRNFATLRSLIAKLEEAIPFIPDTLPAKALVVQDATAARNLIDSTWTIDPATGEMTMGGNIELGATARSFLYLGLELLKLTGVASAVNNIHAKNSVTGSGPSILAEGSDTNIDLVLISKGLTGAVQLGDRTANVDQALRFAGESSDGEITYMEDEARFDFDQDVDVAGDITLTGTVDGEDIQKLKAESSHCLLATNTEIVF